jgi:hypothetical protein
VFAVGVAEVVVVVVDGADVDGPVDFDLTELFSSTLPDFKWEEEDDDDDDEDALSSSELWVASIDGFLLWMSTSEWPSLSKLDWLVGWGGSITTNLSWSGYLILSVVPSEYATYTHIARHEGGGGKKKNKKYENTGKTTHKTTMGKKLCKHHIFDKTNSPCTLTLLSVTLMILPLCHWFLSTCTFTRAPTCGRYLFHFSFFYFLFLFFYFFIFLFFQNNKSICIQEGAR